MSSGKPKPEKGPKLLKVGGRYLINPEGDCRKGIRGKVCELLDLGDDGAAAVVRVAGARRVSAVFPLDLLPLPANPPPPNEPRQKTKTPTKQELREAGSLSREAAEHLHDRGVRGEEATRQLVMNLGRTIHCEIHFLRASTVADCSDCSALLAEALRVGAAHLNEVERETKLIGEVAQYITKHYGDKKIALDDFGWRFLGPKEAHSIQADVEEQFTRLDQPGLVSAVEILEREIPRLSPTGWLLLLPRRADMAAVAVDADTSVAISRYLERLYPGTYKRVDPDVPEPRNRLWTRADADERLLLDALNRLGDEAERLPLLTDNDGWGYRRAPEVAEERRRLEKSLTDVTTADERTKLSNWLATNRWVEERIAAGRTVLKHFDRSRRTTFHLDIDDSELAAYKRRWYQILRERKVRGF